MTTKCKHENAVNLFAGGLVGPGWNMSGYVAQCEQFRCLDCSAWLSLGHSDEEPVAHEIRAVELANHRYEMEYRLSSRFKATHGEVAGWRGEETIGSMRVRHADGSETIEHGTPLNLNSPNWRAGYLARCIVDHDGVGE